MRLRTFLEGKMKQLHMEIEKFLKKNPKPKDKEIHALADKLGIEHSDFEEQVYMMLSDKLREDKVKGGRADKMKPEDFSASELKMGIKIEMEHTDDATLAKEIAMDHLEEIPDYYTRLKKMEKEAGITEMAATIQLDNGTNIGQSALKKFKRKFKDNADGFIEHIQTKFKLSTNDVRRLKAAYEEI